MAVRAAPSVSTVDAGSVPVPAVQAAAECPIGEFLGDLKAHPVSAAYDPSTLLWQDGAGDRDRCNGVTGADGRYRFDAVSTLPYFLRCYQGDSGTNSGVGGLGPPEAIYGALTIGIGPSGSDMMALTPGQPTALRPRW